jgi:hypothetical protein
MFKTRTGNRLQPLVVIPAMLMVAARFVRGP